MNDFVLSMMPPSNPTFDVLRFKVPTESINYFELQVSGQRVLEKWITEHVSLRTDTRPFTKDSLKQEIPDDCQSFNIEGAIDPDRVSHQFFGHVTGTVVIRAKESTVFLAFSQDREVELQPSEEFKFDIEKIISRDSLEFYREFSRHPNHHVLMSYLMWKATIKSSALQSGVFQYVVNQIRMRKRNALQAVLARSKNFQEVENVLFGFGINLIDEMNE